MVRIRRFGLVGMFPLPLTGSWCATWLASTKHGGVGVVGSLDMLLIVFHAFRLLCVRSIEEESSKRHSLQAAELSQRTQIVQIVSNLPVPSNGARLTVFWACRPCGPTGWLALLLTKAGDVEINPGQIT